MFNIKDKNHFIFQYLIKQRHYPSHTLRNTGATLFLLLLVLVSYISAYVLEVNTKN